MSYQGKKAVITGGSTGIGFAAARLFIAGGGRAIITGRDQGALDAAQRELGAAATAIQSDSSSLADIAALAERAGEIAPIDLLFVNAGIAQFEPFDQVSEEFYDRLFAVNLKGAFFTVQRLAPLLRDGGSIVLNTSAVDEKGFAGTAVYSATKAGLRSLARTFATELQPRGIRVNAVSPGPIDTPILLKGGLSSQELDGFTAQVRESNPMKRIGRPDEVAKAALFLGFDATYTNGAELKVDGGLTHL